MTLNEHASKFHIYDGLRAKNNKMKKDLERIKCLVYKLNENCFINLMYDYYIKISEICRTNNNVSGFRQGVC